MIPKKPFQRVIAQCPLMVKADIAWLAYDTLFRQQRAAGSALPWTEINASLMAATVLGTGGEAAGGKVCALCSGSDHIQTECALNVLASEHLFSPPGSSSQTPPAKVPNRRFAPYPGAAVGDNRCRRYNRGSCSASPCRFDHNCSFCNSPNHPVIHCPRLEQSRGARPPKGGQGDPTKPSQGY